MQGTDVLHFFIASKEENRLHHAFALTGPESPEKWNVICGFLKKFSEKQPEDRLLKEGNHPDLVLLEPQDGVISVDQIRTLPKIISYPPLEAWKRFVVFPSAGSMNVQAANALLKILEEPPHHTIFFLLVSDMNDLLPTIQSRVQQVRFSPLKNSDLLSQEEVAAVGMPDLVYSYAEGSFSRAKQVVEKPEILDALEEASEQLISLWEGSPKVSSQHLSWLEGLDQEEKCDLAVTAWQFVIRDFQFVCLSAEKKNLVFQKLWDRLQKLKERSSDSLALELGQKGEKISRYRVYREFHGNLKVNIVSLFTDLQLFSIGKP